MPPAMIDRSGLGFYFVSHEVGIGKDFVVFRHFVGRVTELPEIG
jgi:hypothetical protein